MAWFLILQAAILLILGIYHYVILSFGPVLFDQLIRGEFTAGNLLQNIQMFVRELFRQASLENELSTLIESLLLFVLALFAIMAAFGFFSQRPLAWLFAMIVQASTLSLAITLYFIKKPMHIYLLMLSGIFMVIYLNYADIYRTFNKRNLRELSDHES